MEEDLLYLDASPFTMKRIFPPAPILLEKCHPAEASCIPCFFILNIVFSPRQTSRNIPVDSLQGGTMTLKKFIVRRDVGTSVSGLFPFF